MKVAIQGARGAFSHKAAQLFAEQMDLPPKELQLVMCRSFDDAFERLLAGTAEFAAIPLENSSVGTIVANYDLLWRNPVTVVSEIYVDVQHNLLGLEGCTIESLNEIYSHPVALDQCKKFLASVPQARAIAFWDTGGSAFHVKEQNDRTIAAIASELAATEAGLKILKRNLEDYSGNRTRFGIILGSDSASQSDKLQAKALNLYQGNPHYKLSCVVELAHEPGTLARLLGAMSECQANLTKIESRPIPETPWHYRFFLDMQLERQNDACALESIEKLTSANKILGRYPIWNY
jgi:prephenate dehydratase